MPQQNYNSCRFVTTDRLTLWYTTMGVIIIIACKLKIILIHKLGIINS